MGKHTTDVVVALVAIAAIVYLVTKLNAQRLTSAPVDGPVGTARTARTAMTATKPVGPRLLCVEGSYAEWFAGVVYGLARTTPSTNTRDLPSYLRSFAQDLWFQCDTIARAIRDTSMRSIPSLSGNVSKFCFGTNGTRADTAAQIAYDVASVVQVNGKPVGTMMRDNHGSLSVEEVAAFWWFAARQFMHVAHARPVQTKSGC